MNKINDEIENLLMRCANEGGSIVSTGQLSTIQIAAAKACDRMALIGALGFVYMPPNTSAQAPSSEVLEYREAIKEFAGAMDWYSQDTYGNCITVPQDRAREAMEIVNKYNYDIEEALTESYVERNHKRAAELLQYLFSSNALMECDEAYELSEIIANLSNTKSPRL